MNDIQRELAAIRDEITQLKLMLLAAAFVYGLYHNGLDWILPYAIFGTLAFMFVRGVWRHRKASKKAELLLRTED